MHGALAIERAMVVLGVPLNRAMGARLIDADDPTRGALCEIGALADNGAGGAHSAALTTLLELAGYLALLPALEPHEHAVTHMISVQLVAAARAGERIEAHGTVDRRTKRMAFVAATATVGDRLIARAQVTKSIVAFG